MFLVKGTVEPARSYQWLWGHKRIGRRNFDFFSEREGLAPTIISSNFPHDSFRRGETGKDMGTEGLGTAPCFTSIVEYASRTCFGAGIGSLLSVLMLWSTREKGGFHTSPSRGSRRSSAASARGAECSGEDITVDSVSTVYWESIDSASESSERGDAGLGSRDRAEGRFFVDVPSGESR